MNATPNWFDLLVVVFLGVGIMRGRKRGMSEELLDVLQWLCIVVVGALLYEPFGKAIASATNFSPFVSNITAYAAIAVLLKLAVSAFKRAVGEKLVHSDAFGNFEYYLGMAAGAVRFLCILLFSINFLHAKHISEAERAATAKMQADNFGSISFPTFSSLQQGIFHESATGPFLRKHLRAQLLEPVSGGGSRGDTIGRRRERAVDEVLR